MLTRTTTSQNFNVDQRINSWMVVQQKDKKDSGVLDCNQGLALGNFICKIYKPLGQNFIIKKYLEQCTLYKNKPNILMGMRESILQILGNTQKLGETSITASKTLKTLLR